MKATVFIAYIFLLMYFVVGVAFIYLFVLVVRALKKYIKSEPVRKEKAESAKSLGEVIKRYRTQRKMTQEFVAESLGVSRQAVSKWESGVTQLHIYSIKTLGIGTGDIAIFIKKERIFASFIMVVTTIITFLRLKIWSVLRFKLHLSNGEIEVVIN